MLMMPGELRNTHRSQEVMRLEKKAVDQKVAQVREIVKHVSNNDIVMALQTYDYDVSQTIQAFCEEGASAALNEWKTEGKKNKSKNKRKKAGPHGGSSENGAGPTDDASSVGVSKSDLSTGPNSINGDLGNDYLSSGYSAQHNMLWNSTMPPYNVVPIGGGQPGGGDDGEKGGAFPPYYHAPPSMPLYDPTMGGFGGHSPHQAGGINSPPPPLYHYMGPGGQIIYSYAPPQGMVPPLPPSAGIGGSHMPGYHTSPTGMMYPPGVSVNVPSPNNSEPGAGSFNVSLPTSFHSSTFSPAGGGGTGLTVGPIPPSNSAGPYYMGGVQQGGTIGSPVGGAYHHMTSSGGIAPIGPPGGGMITNGFLPPSSQQQHNTGFRGSGGPGDYSDGGRIQYPLGTSISGGSSAAIPPSFSTAYSADSSVVGDSLSKQSSAAVGGSTKSMNGTRGASNSESMTVHLNDSKSQRSSGGGNNARRGRGVGDATPRAVNNTNSASSKHQPQPTSRDGFGGGVTNSTFPLAANQVPSSSTVTPQLANQDDSVAKKKAVERELKNLDRHDVAVERVQRIFNEEIEKATTRLRRSFMEIRTALNEREAVLFHELEKCKLDGTSMLNERIAKAQDLHQQCVRAPALKDAQISELKTEIKHFVTQRKHEEEFGSTLRFEYEPDHVLNLVRGFGNVIPVKGFPNQRHNSVSSCGGGGGHDATSTTAGATLKPDETSVEMGGITIKSDTMTSEQLADLHRQIQDSLKLQGISSDILPEVSGVVSMPVRRTVRAPRGGAGPRGGSRGRGGFTGRGGRGGGVRGGPAGSGGRMLKMPQLSILEESSTAAK